MLRSGLFFILTLISCSAETSSGGLPPDGGVGTDTGGVGGVPTPTFHSARVFPGARSQYAAQVMVDAAGAVYLLGRTADTITFSPTVSFTPVDTKYADWFLVKLDGNLAPLWAKGLGGRSSETSARVGLDAAGNIVLARDHVGPLTIDGVTFDNPSTSQPLTALVSFDGAGKIRWSKQISTRGCGLMVFPSGGFALGGCLDGANGHDFGTGKLTPAYLERSNALFDATGAVRQTFLAAFEQCVAGTSDGGMLVGGERTDPNTVAGTAIPATTSADTVYLASVGPDGAARHVRTIGASAWDISSSCRVVQLSNGERFANLSSASTLDLPEGPFKAPKDHSTLLRLSEDLSIQWKAAVLGGTTVHSGGGGGLTLVASTDGPYQLLGRTLTGKLGSSISSRDALVAGVDANFTQVQWGVRIAEAGNGGPSSAVDPSNGDIVLFGLVNVRPIELDTKLTGDSDSDLWVARVRPPR